LCRKFGCIVGYGKQGAIRWFDAGNNPVSNLTVSPATTTTYYAEAYTATSVSARKAVTVTVNPLPVITSSTPGSRTGEGTVTLGATANTGVVNWYNVATGGTSLWTGNTFTTPSIATTTPYYVEAFSNNCGVSSRTMVVATVNPSSGGGVDVDFSTMACEGREFNFIRTIGVGSSQDSPTWKIACRMRPVLAIKGLTSGSKFDIEVYQNGTVIQSEHDIIISSANTQYGGLYAINAGYIYKIRIINTGSIPLSGADFQLQLRVE
jgi:hypothetical protein